MIVILCVFGQVSKLLVFYVIWKFYIWYVTSGNRSLVLWHTFVISLTACQVHMKQLHPICNPSKLYEWSKQKVMYNKQLQGKTYLKRIKTL